ncbi:MAG: 1-deoxy-D-xylulose-5-phosphate synthase [Ruminococcus sp.]|uniref:1-deoxy-D-xylulose-5-phosphate synthase n=1 Tax=Ruminococcus sp. TaxID=41978 RepID=UPI002872B6A3|nr:1-deoxy-D-xylulose-5-phosphate synthase [Ruminococcus sp.]MBQ3286189.1 1-deoxy-D-xylulose-5-phosphate synthase [Ruminococcus sp.]
MSYEILSKIESPADLKALDNKQLDLLCAEIREKLIDIISVNGGHLSSNLGVVELTVALHKVFNCPADSVVFDVGHQSYTHKMLTGRYGMIDTIRREGGLSGFPKRSESDCDAFNAGHASTSISAALGIAKAKALSGDKSYTVAIIGDGSLTGGMAYEGLNNAGQHKKNFIVILNDNRMSISRNVGAMARYLSSIRMQPWYRRLKHGTERALSKLPLLGKPIGEVLKRSKSKVKHVMYRHTIFDKLGLSYYGPVDGHNMEDLINALNTVRQSKDPCLLHVVTKKGKGYKYAEDDSASYHGVGSFNVDTGEPISSKENFSAVFGRKLCELAEADSCVCAVTAAMRTGTGLQDFVKLYKDRFFDVGIAEEHAVTFSAGLALNGMLPVFAVYSTFLQRSYDQLIHDASMQKAHLVLAVDRAGVVGEDGETHQGLFDVSMLNAIPDTTVYSPCYFDGLERCLTEALFEDDGLVAVRYPRGGEGRKPEGYNRENTNYELYGDRDADTLLVTYGRLFSEAVAAREIMKEQGKELCILKLCRIKPIDERAVKLASDFKNIRFFEEGMRSGSVADVFRDMLDRQNYGGSYKVTAVDNIYVQHASVASTLKTLGLDALSMAQSLMNDEVSA